MATEQFHFHYGADQLISTPQNHFESGSSIIESEQPYSHEEVRCLPQGRVLERFAHTANGPSHVSEFDVACTSAHCRRR